MASESSVCPRKALRGSPEERFAKSYEIADTGCWHWIGSLKDSGYGCLNVGGRTEYAHRFAWMHLRGPIPKGLTIDHLCRVRKCVNPDHLEVVTQKVNTLRGDGPSAKQARQIECIHGHSLVGDNLYIVPSTGKRQCRICRRESNRRCQTIYRAVKRAARLTAKLKGKSLESKGGI